MYDTFYKLTADPFRLTPDHRFSFGHSSYAEAKAYLEYALYRSEGFIIITGGPGTGKTTLIGEVLSGVDKSRVQVATLSSTQLEGRDLLHLVNSSFGLRLQDNSKVGLLLSLEQFLAQQSRNGHHSVLIVDEAQGLSPQALEELRLLANLQLNDRLLLQVFLVGQEQLRDVVQAPGMEHLSQRIIAAAHLEPLHLEDTVNYIEHRLSRVRWQGDPGITGGALRLVHKYSGGVPRRINLICSRLFLHGSMEGKHELTGADAQSIIEDLQSEGLIAKDVPEPDIAETDAVDEMLSLPRVGNVPAADAAPHADDTTQSGADPSANGQVSSAFVEQVRAPRKPPLHEAMGHVIAELEGAGNRSATSTRHERRTAAADTGHAGGRSDQPKRQPDAMRATSDRTSVSRPGHSVLTKKGLFDNIWSRLALVAAFGGLIFAVTQQGFDPGSEEASDAAMKRLDTTAPLTLQPPRDAASQSNQFGAVENPVTELHQADQQVLSDQSSAGQGFADKTGVEPEAGSAGELPASGVGVVTADSLAMLPGDSAVAKKGEILRAAPDDESMASSSAPRKTTAGDLESVSVISRAAEEERQALVSRQKEGQSPISNSESVVPGDQSLRVVEIPADQSGQSALQLERARLKREAEQRFSQQVAQVEDQSRPSLAAPIASVPKQVESTVPAATANTPVPITSGSRVTASQPKVTTSAIKPSQPKTSVKTVKPAQPAIVTPSVPKVANVPVVVAKVQATPAEAPVLSPNRIRSTLLDGGWSSNGKPASLLPSDVTLCRGTGNNIDCWSVPRNITTKYGEALYKIEATLQNFQSGGQFRVSYRTFVKLTDSAATNSVQSDAGNDDWQVSEHAMDCQLLRSDKVSCREGKGVTRSYNRQ